MSLEDERVRFYFRHREVIEEWAALRGEAAVAVDEWMTQLGPDIDDLAASLGPDVRMTAFLDENHAWPAFRLVRTSWGYDAADEDGVSISLEWLRARTTMRGELTPYVGVRAHKGHPAGVAIRASDAFRQTKQSRKDRGSAWWPAYGYVAPPLDFPSSADGYRDVLVDALRAAWSAYAPLVAGRS